MSIQRCCPPARVTARTFDRETALFKAVADSYRLRILATLAKSADPVCVCDFTDAFPLNQPTVSHHLKILREAELVTCERRGTWVYYRLEPNAAERIESAIVNILKQKVAA
ncbi:MAG TPA: metalloregulator ArsR/SmtB family transcription factor [Candidatus Baltobacteraceae bacterium]|jgi:ArsR family transcriptional regulator|nr:metalloregulator ArsR/SmtB family transcription factor [Candidatus Baltobacteraceae bacterium]